MYKSKYHGKFTPKNPSKYLGDPNNIVFRSLLERSFMQYLDSNKNILQWGSEELVIDYINPLDMSKHRYFPDMIVIAKNHKEEIKKFLIEIKPECQTKEPIKKENSKSKKYLLEVTTWITNNAKWNAAKKWCDKNGFEFKLITEIDIKGKKNKPPRRS